MWRRWYTWYVFYLAWLSVIHSEVQLFYSFEHRTGAGFLQCYFFTGFSRGTVLFLMKSFYCIIMGSLPFRYARRMDISLSWALRLRSRSHAFKRGQMRWSLTFINHIHVYSTLLLLANIDLKSTGFLWRLHTNVVLMKRNPSLLALERIVIKTNKIYKHIYNQSYHLI